MPPRSPTTVGMAVETTVISIAAIERLSSRETTVRGRLVFIVRGRCAGRREDATVRSRTGGARRSGDEGPDGTDRPVDLLGRIEDARREPRVRHGVRAGA